MNVKPMVALIAVIIILYPTTGLAKESKNKSKNKAPAESSKTEVAPVTSKPAISAKESAQAPWNYPPVIRVTEWGEEIRIEVDNDKAMAPEQVFDIDSIRLETEKGEMLGFKTFGNQETERHAEFMIDPKILKLEKARIVVHGILMGDWSKIVPLESPLWKKGDAQAKAESQNTIKDQPMPPADSKVEIKK